VEFGFLILLINLSFVRILFLVNKTKSALKRRVTVVKKYCIIVKLYICLDIISKRVKVQFIQ